MKTCVTTKFLLYLMAMEQHTTSWGNFLRNLFISLHHKTFSSHWTSIGLTKKTYFLHPYSILISVPIFYPSSVITRNFTIKMNKWDDRSSNPEFYVYNAIFQLTELNSRNNWCTNSFLNKGVPILSNEKW
jgi:hypothetical protein